MFKQFSSLKTKKNCFCKSFLLLETLQNTFQRQKQQKSLKAKKYFLNESLYVFGVNKQFLNVYKNKQYFFGKV